MSDFRFAEIDLVHGIWGVVVFVVLMLALERRIGSALDRLISKHMQSQLVQRPTRCGNHGPKIRVRESSDLEALDRRWT